MHARAAQPGCRNSAAGRRPTGCGGCRRARCARIAGVGACRPSGATGGSRRSCQTIALWSASPVVRSHSTTVSRWLVMPIAATSPPQSAASFSVSAVSRQMSSGSCSTPPGGGILLLGLTARRLAGQAIRPERHAARRGGALIDAEDDRAGYAAGSRGVLALRGRKGRMRR